jgi:hypothetical protein
MFKYKPSRTKKPLVSFVNILPKNISVSMKFFALQILFLNDISSKFKLKITYVLNNQVQFSRSTYQI